MPWRYAVFAQDEDGFPDKEQLDITIQTTVQEAEKLAEKLAGDPTNYVICGWLEGE